MSNEKKISFQLATLPTSFVTSGAITANCGFSYKFLTKETMTVLYSKSDIVVHLVSFPKIEVLFFISFEREH